MSATAERPADGRPAGIGPTLREGGLALSAIIAVALAARLIGLNSDLWTDEILALQQSFRLSMMDVITTFPGDNHHPLYSVFARAALVMFGEAPWVLRLPSVLFGVGTVAATYVVARLAAPRVEALVASLILAVSYHHVWFSQNARGYTLIGLLAMLSTWALVLMLENGSWRMALLYALSAALAAYTHATMVFVAIGHAVVALLDLARPEHGRRRTDWRVPAAAFTLAAVFTVLFYAPMLGQVLDFFINSESSLLSASTPAWALRETVRVLLIGIGGPGLVLAGVVLTAGAVVGIAGFVAIFRANRNVALAFALPPLAVLIGALAGRGTMYPRFYFFAAGMALIVVVRGLFAGAESLRRVFPALPASGLATAFAVVVIVASAASLTMNYRYPKQDFAGAMRFVQASRAPGDVVGFAGATGDPYRSIYGQDWPTLATVADVEALRARGRAWLIYTFPRYLEAETPDVAAVIRRDCREQAVFPGTVGGGDMIVCTLEPA